MLWLHGRFSCKLFNLTKKLNFISKRERNYKGYEVKQASLVIGALGTIVTKLLENLNIITNKKRESKYLAKMMQRATICGTLEAMDRFIGTINY